MEFADAVSRKDPELFHHTASLVAESVVLRIQESTCLQLHKFSLVVLDALHLGVDDTTCTLVSLFERSEDIPSILAGAIHVVNFGVASSISQGWKQDVLKVYGKLVSLVGWISEAAASTSYNLGKPVPACTFQSISCMVHCCPSVRV